MSLVPLIDVTLETLPRLSEKVVRKYVLTRNRVILDLRKVAGPHDWLEFRLEGFTHVWFDTGIYTFSDEGFGDLVSVREILGVNGTIIFMPGVPLMKQRVPIELTQKKPVAKRLPYTGYLP